MLDGWQAVLKLFNNLGESGGVALAAIVASITWIFQTYSGFVVGLWKERNKYSKFAAALHAEIGASIKNYETEFSEFAKMKNLKEVERMHKAGKPRAFLLTSAETNHVFDTVKKQIVALPVALIKPTLDFFTEDGLFEKAYQLVGSADFKSAPKDKKEEAIEKKYETARSCVEFGRKALAAYEKYARDQLSFKFNLVLAHMLAFGIFLELAL